MGGRPQKREKASGRKRLNLGSTWNLKWTHVGIGVRCLRWDVVLVLRCPRFTLGRCPRFTLFTLFTLGRCPRFTLSSFYVGTLVQVYVVYVGTLVQVYVVYVGTLVQVYVGTGLRLKMGTGLR